MESSRKIGSNGYALQQFRLYFFNFRAVIMTAHFVLFSRTGQSELKPINFCLQTPSATLSVQINTYALS